MKIAAINFLGGPVPHALRSVVFVAALCVVSVAWGSAQDSNVDRLQAIRMCSDKVASVGPRLVDWEKGKMKKAGLDPSAPHWRVEYSGHFNSELKRCFVELTNTLSKDGIILNATIYDAYEGQFIGKLAKIKKTGESEFVVFGGDVFGKIATEVEYQALMQK